MALPPVPGFRQRHRRRLLLVPAPAAEVGVPAAEVTPRPAPAAPKALLVVAHPDDEYYVAATVYRIATELGGVVDQVVITNGEAGFHYSQLAERFYGVPLANESDGRSHLPAIRKQETRRAGRILGIRQQFFLDEQDNRFGLDADEALSEVWDRARVLNFLTARLAAESYDFVFVLLPREDTHGHHKAAAVLALEAAAAVPAERRPVVLGAEPAHAFQPAAEFRGLAGYASTRALSPTPVLAFDRTRSLGGDGALSYEIVVNWVIAEHKSQGLFQTDCGRHGVELFWLFDQNPRSATARVHALAEMLHACGEGADADVGRKQA